MSEQEILKSKGYLPAMEVAKKLGRHVTNIYRLVYRKKLKGIKVGRHWYIHSQSINDFLGPAASLFELTSSAKKGA